MKDLDIRFYINGEWVRWGHVMVCQKYFEYYKHNEKIINGINVSYIKLFFKKNKDRYNLLNDSLYYGNDVMMKWNPKKWKVYSYSHFTHIAIRLERLSNYNELL